MPYSCTDCSADIRQPWDDELAKNPHTCENCHHPLCWDCKQMDVSGNDWCERCAHDRRISNPYDFNH